MSPKEVTSPLFFILCLLTTSPKHSTLSLVHMPMTLISASHKDSATACRMIQSHLIMINLWTKRWKIKINENKSTHITFTMRKSVCPPVTFNNKVIPSSDEVKYLGLIFDKCLTGAHILNKNVNQ